MPQTEKMRQITVEGAPQPFEIPESWDEFQTSAYLKEYRKKYPDKFKPATAAPAAPVQDGAKATATGGPPQRPKPPESTPASILTYGMELQQQGRGQEAAKQTTEALSKPLLPEGYLQRFIIRAALTPIGQGNQAKAIYEEHKANLGKATEHPEKWIRNAIWNSLSDLGEVGDDTLRGLSSPENLALIAGMALAPEGTIPVLISRLVAGGFALSQAKEAADHLVKSYQLHLAGDDVAAGKELANSTVTTAFAILSGTGAAHEGGVKGKLREEWKQHFEKEGHNAKDAARMADLQVARSGEAPPEVPSRHTSAAEVKAAESAQHRQQAGVPLAEHPEVRTGARRTPESATPPLRSEAIPTPAAVPSEEKVPRETVEEAAYGAGVTPLGVQTGGKEPWHMFSDPQVGGTFNIRESELVGKSTEEAGSIIRKRAEKHREKNAPGTEADSDLRKNKIADAARAHDEFRERFDEARAVPMPARQQPGPPMPTVQQQRPAIDRTLRQQIVEGWNQIANLISPASRGPHAKAAALTLREAAAKIAADDEKADHALREYRAHFDRILRNNPQAGLDWIDEYEQGVIHAGNRPTAEKVLAQRWKDLQTRTWNEVRRREGMQRFIDDYFPHLFKDPAQAAQLFSRRPLEGPRSWRFKRQFPTLKDALEFARSQGITLEPMYENPVDYMTAKLHEMNKYIHLHDFVETMKDVGVLQFSPDIKPPLGMAKIEDPIGTVYGSPTETITLREAYDKVLFEQLNQFTRSLGIDHIRKVKLRGGAGVWGYTIKGADKVWTKHAGPEFVLTHELGHQLHFRYPELDALIKDPNTIEELRQLADLRMEGIPQNQVSDYYRRYVRKGTEKIANLIHAYVHVREKGRKVAPNTFARLDHIIEQHPELQPLRDIQPGLVIGSNEVQQSLYVGRRIFGYYYAPEGAARVINNYLKPGLAGKPLFELARRPANLLNQIQLGTVSAFHFVFTGMDSTVSMWSLGLQRVKRGDIKGGLGAIARGNILTAPIETYVRGSKVLKEFYGTPQGQFYADTVDRLIQAGGRVKMDSFYHNSSVETFLRAWRRGQATKVATSAIPAAVEVLASPIMKNWVPRMKLGTFSLLAEEELARLGPNANLWEQRGALARAWDSTDNRLGQLVYDNLFWNRTLKDIGLISVRSLGWNLGTFREIGGGYIDATKFVATRGKSGITPRLAYTLALPAVIAMHGAMLQYLLTGKGPTQLLDYFYPKTGRTNPDGSEERVAMPSYMKDEISYAGGFRLGVERGLRQVAATLGHKANPELSMVLEMMRNRDFYGTKIRNEDDPTVKQLGDTMKYVGTQFEPFWIRNLEQRKQAEGEITPRNFIESMFGIMPAPRSVTRSTAEALAADYLSEHMPSGARTPEKAKAARERGELIRQFRTNAPDHFKNLSEALRNGQITQADRRDILRSMRMTPLQMMVERLGLEQALNVYDRADAKEKEQLKRILHGKLHLLREMPREKQEEIRPRLDKIFGKPETLPLEDDYEPVPEREPSIP